MNESFKYLQNGSDIRGIALAGVEGEDVNLTTDIALRIGKAFATWLSVENDMNIGDLQIAIGMDSRLSGPELGRAFIDGAILVGTNVLSTGLCTTPAMFMATQFSETNCDGGVMLTASHLPYNRNGFKFFTSRSGLEKADISQLLAMVEEDKWMTPVRAGEAKEIDLLSIYSEFICDLIRKGSGSDQPLRNMKILVDAGNGSGGFFATQILQKLGADASSVWFPLAS